MSLPLDPVLLPAGIVLITGVFMLLAGRKMLRCGLAILGALGGCLIGNSLAPIVPAALSPLALSVVGALLGLGLGLLLWRITVATVMAASCATVSSLALLLAVNSGVVSPVPPSAAQADAIKTPPHPTDSLEVEPVGWVTKPPPPSFQERLGAAAVTAAKEDASERLNAFSGGINRWLAGLNIRLSDVLARAQGAWQTLDSPLQSALMGIAVLGGLFGFLFGLVAWKWSGAVVTALAGAGLVLLGVLLTVEVLSPLTGASLWDLHPGLWLGGWILLGSAGALISWQIERRHADSEEAEPA